jgi:hypothetical protein
MARHVDDTAAEANVCAMRARVEDAITSKSSPMMKSSNKIPGAVPVYFGNLPGGR